MTDIQLPDLPETSFGHWGTGKFNVYYDVSQMREYARAAVEADRAQRNADESDALTVAHMLGYEDGRKATCKERLQVERERAVFEAWAAGEMPLDRYGDSYACLDTEIAWQAWQGRAALGKGE